jgi:hypothetical protein
VPADLLTEDAQIKTVPLDLGAEIERYGAQTKGGVGVSFAAG